MTKELTVVHEQEVLGQGFKVYGTVEEPLFLAKDVAEWIEYDTNQVGKMILKVDDDEIIKKHRNTDTGLKESWFLTEDGIYEVLMQSRKPVAKEWKKEVKKILKTIRTSGGYISNSDLMVNTYFGDMPDEKKAFMKGLLDTIEEKQKQLAVMAPKAEYFDHLVDRNLLTNFRDTAKEIHVGQNQLINFLLEAKYIYRDANNKLKPYAEYTPELFELKEWTRRGVAGSQTLITPRGRETIRLLMGKTK